MSRRLRSAQKALQATASSSSTATRATSSSTSIPETQLFRDDTAWENWLSVNHTSSTGLWLKISKKASGISSVTYEEALNTALCYGWIDGQKKSHDASHFLQKFTPRRKNSTWSKRNVGKIAELITAGRMQPGGLKEVDAAKADGRWERAYSSPSNIQVPEGFQAALEGNKEAKSFFEGLNKSKRYMILLRIEMVKRAETRRRKIEEFVGMLADHKTL
ncbi:bacteriocin-protection, YdeI or OmpD-associated-domain-containing protein [Rhypophila decipiens]|uniref:Bacteriocin-protection, YdeI or OmpD-associated-domain-containing protein n=1 Tax=Rhypophila decipiens TaxID=261697 RepID=A0AAN7B0K3_9PEZI|nr:bacteriocin-protection, YdeI or OmpD-associated-domain-containing protein [Rhypophila decipiens]